MSELRVSPPKVFPGATRAAKPSLDAAGAADAYRQTGFLLGKDIGLLLEAFAAEGRAAEAASAPKLRTRVMAGVMGLWSRGWLCRLEAMHAAECGNYAAAIPLVRAAADAVAAEALLLQTEGHEWLEWLAAGGIGLAAEEHATEYRLHAFRAAEVLAGHPVLGPLYRVVSDFSMPHFGATLLVAGGESGPGRIATTFGDRDFHLALAELVFGWLLDLAGVQLRLQEEYAAVFGSPESGLAELAARCAARAGEPDRCHVETVELGGERRYLIQHWRRVSGGAPKRLLL